MWVNNGLRPGAVVSQRWHLGQTPVLSGPGALGPPRTGSSSSSCSTLAGLLHLRAELWPTEASYSVHHKPPPAFWVHSPGPDWPPTPVLQGPPGPRGSTWELRLLVDEWA